MFSYVGPRHVKVAGLWDEQSLYATNPETGEIDQDLLMNNFKGVHVIVGTPEYLSRVGVGKSIVVCRRIVRARARRRILLFVVHPPPRRLPSSIRA